MSKFEIGDKVKVIKNLNNPAETEDKYSYIGKYGVIIDEDNDRMFPYTVKFNNPLRRSIKGYVVEETNFLEEELELVD